jgi:two-component system, NarL family, nitrate/nitrite response regulator NarL
VHDGTHATRVASTTAPGRDGVACLIAAVFAGRGVLHSGIEGLLRSIPDARVVHWCGTPNEFGAVLSQRILDRAVGTLTEAAWLDEHWTALTGQNVTTLLMVDGASIDALPTNAEQPASGYPWQRCAATESMRELMRPTQRGHLPMSADLLRVAARPAPGVTPGRLGATRLTGRERQALALLVEGLSNKQIARQLSISSHGAKRLVTSIMLKLDAPNRTQAAVTAVRAGLVDAA